MGDDGNLAFPAATAHSITWTEGPPATGGSGYGYAAAPPLRFLDPPAGPLANRARGQKQGLARPGAARSRQCPAGSPGLWHRCSGRPDHRVRRGCAWKYVLVFAIRRLSFPAPCLTGPTEGFRPPRAPLIQMHHLCCKMPSSLTTPMASTAGPANDVHALSSTTWTWTELTGALEGSRPAPRSKMGFASAKTGQIYMFGGIGRP